MKKCGVGHMRIPDVDVRKRWKEWSREIRKKGWTIGKIQRNRYYPDLLMADVYNDVDIEADTCLV